MTEHILAVEGKEIRCSKNIHLLSSPDQEALRLYLTLQETQNDVFPHLPAGYEIRGVGTFGDHKMSDGSRMSVLAEYVIVKVDDAETYFRAINIYVSDEHMPDLFLDIINFHRENGATIRERIDLPLVTIL